MVLVDADYKFIWANLSGLGSASNAQIYNDSDLKEGTEGGTIGLPEPERLPYRTKGVIYFLIGNSAFVLCPTMHDEAIQH